MNNYSEEKETSISEHDIFIKKEHDIFNKKECKGKKKIPISLISSKIKRNVIFLRQQCKLIKTTFNKRLNGLLKKAVELQALTGSVIDLKFSDPQQKVVYHYCTNDQTYDFVIKINSNDAIREEDNLNLKGKNTMNIQEYIQQENFWNQIKKLSKIYVYNETHYPQFNKKDSKAINLSNQQQQKIPFQENLKPKKMIKLSETQNLSIQIPQQNIQLIQRQNVLNSIIQLFFEQEIIQKNSRSNEQNLQYSIINDQNDIKKSDLNGIKTPSSSAFKFVNSSQQGINKNWIYMLQFSDNSRNQQQKEIPLISHKNPTSYEDYGEMNYSPFNKFEKKNLIIQNNQNENYLGDTKQFCDQQFKNKQ